MSKAFANSLSQLAHTTVQVSAYPLEEGAYEDDGWFGASVYLAFQGGALLRTDFWRVIEGDKSTISSFDHRQQYGLPEPIDAVKALGEILNGKLVTSASADFETGDLAFEFGANLKLQVFNFTGYEIWEIKFPDGTGQYSNFFEKGF